MMDTSNEPQHSPSATKARAEVSSDRNSSIELLRLISMLLILSLHVNYFAFGSPTAMEFRVAPAASFLRTALESFAIVGVNVFVLISGWFGIRPRINRVASFLFQTSFFCCVLYVGGLAFGTSYSSPDMIESLFLLGGTNWFLRSYLLLYTLSPVLESFIATATKKTLRNTLIVFFLFQTFLGGCSPVKTTSRFSGAATLRCRFSDSISWPDT